MSKSIRIIQNLLEEYDVPVNVINKLYNMINRKEIYHEDVINFNNSNFIGNIYLTGPTYQQNINKINEYFRYLNIHPTSVYIKFEDNTVEQILLNAGIGDGTGITHEAAAAVRSLPSFRDNTDIVSFNELRLFTNVKNLPSSCFNGCTNLQSIDISNITSMGQQVFYNCSSLNDLGIENFPIPFYDRESQYWTFNNCTSLGVGKDLDIIYSSELTHASANTFKNTGYKTVTVHGENLVRVYQQGSGEYEPFVYMPNLEKYDISDTKIDEIPWTEYFSHATTIISSPYATVMNWGTFNTLSENIRYYIILSTTVPTTTDGLEYWKLHANTYIYVRDELVNDFKTDAKWSTSQAIINKIKPLSELPHEITWYTKDRDFSQYFE